MMIVDTLAVERVEPRGGGDILATIFGPFDVGLVAQDTRIALSNIADSHERTDVQAHTIIQVGLPADGLLLQRLPSHEDVVRRFPLQDQLQLLFQRFGGGQLFLSAVNTTGDIVALGFQSPR